MYEMICVISYTPSPDRRQDRTRVFDRTIVYRPRRQRPELRPRDDRRATKRGPLHARTDAYRTFTVGIIYPYTTAGVLYTVSPKPVGTARPAIILHRAVEQRGAARAEPLQRSSRRSAPDGSAPIAPRALLTRLLSSRIARRCARARGFTCNMPRMHAQARARVWRQHACKTHASAHHSALLAQEGASLWGRRSGPPVPLEVGQLLLILDLRERLLLGRLGGCDRGLVLLRRAERL
jgi:hypothetical protein